MTGTTEGTDERLRLRWKTTETAMVTEATMEAETFCKKNFRVVHCALLTIKGENFSGFVR